jgi:hypothetical protein
VFTACLTTPIKVALRWFCSRSLLRHDGLTKELIDRWAGGGGVGGGGGGWGGGRPLWGAPGAGRCTPGPHRTPPQPPPPPPAPPPSPNPAATPRIPGRQTDRKTPLGELNWIFTAITDTIAWNSLPRATFQKLFRQAGGGARQRGAPAPSPPTSPAHQPPPHSNPPPSPPPPRTCWSPPCSATSCWRSASWPQPTRRPCRGRGCRRRTSTRCGRRGTWLQRCACCRWAGDGGLGWLGWGWAPSRRRGCGVPGLPAHEPLPSRPLLRPTTDVFPSPTHLQLPALLADPAAEFTPSTFFAEQLTAFELWLAHGSADKRPPEQLPIVLQARAGWRGWQGSGWEPLGGGPKERCEARCSSGAQPPDRALPPANPLSLPQVLLSQVHRLRALVLLGRFLDMGLWAVDLALSVGIFPYVLKLLQVGGKGGGWAEEGQADQRAAAVQLSGAAGPRAAPRLRPAAPPPPSTPLPQDDVVRPAHDAGVHLGQDPGAGHQLPGGGRQAVQANSITPVWRPMGLTHARPPACMAPGRAPRRCAAGAATLPPSPPLPPQRPTW